MNPESTHYITYLLRLWPVVEVEERCWRAVLENPRTGERQVFRDFAALCAFLEARTSSSLRDDEGPLALYTTDEPL